MSDIVIKSTIGNMFEIEGISQISGRQMMKFNIFLNALSDVDVEKDKDVLKLVYQITDKNLIAKSVNQVKELIEKMGYSVSMDSDTLAIVDGWQDAQVMLDITFGKLKEIKSSAVEESIDYERFCKACDENLIIKLRDYQYKAAYLLCTGNGGFDFSVPGAGKTIITYATYRYLKNSHVVNQVFIIGPSSSYNAWFDEYKTCFGVEPDFENLSLEATKDCKIYLQASEKNHREITFVNIEKIRLLTREISEFISKANTLLIIDEAHKIKNPGAAVTTAALEITKHAHARIILTGTPMPNGYEDLYSLAKTLSPYKSILPYGYSQLKQMTKGSVSLEQSEKIRESISPYYSRISKKYLLEKGELLEPIYHDVYCEMSDEQDNLYSRLNDFCGKLNENIDEDILFNLKKAISIRKMQISANPALLQKSLVSSMDELKSEYAGIDASEDTDIAKLIKADRTLMSEFAESSIVKIIGKYANGMSITAKNQKAVEITAQLVGEGKKVLLWDVFVKNMEVLQALIQNKLCTKVEIVNGAVSGIDRQMAIKNFREGSSMVLIANPATLAESISLHRVCQNAIYVNRNFNAAQFIQSKDRIHRINMPIGTTANYYFLINNDSIDSCVNQRLEEKENRMLAILDADDIEIGGEELEDTAVMSNQDVEESYKR